MQMHLPIPHIDYLVLIFVREGSFHEKTSQCSKKDKKWLKTLSIAQISISFAAIQSTNFK